MNAPKWSPSLLAMFTRPFGQILEVSSGEVPGQVVLQWSDVDLVGDATPQKGERITFNLLELPDLIKALERDQETHAGLQ